MTLETHVIDREDKRDILWSALAGPILGILPEQEFLERKIPFYRPVVGILCSGYLEFLSAVILGSIFAPGNPEYLLGALSLGVSGAARVDNELQGDHPLFKKPRGNLALELVYNLTIKPMILKPISYLLEKRASPDNWTRE